MSETITTLVQAIRSGDATATEDAFAAAMAEKLAPRIDDFRQQVAANMFSSSEQTAEESNDETNVEPEGATE